MKILLLCNKPPFPPRDGGSIATSGMAKAFAHLGHQVRILAMSTPKHQFDEDSMINEPLPDNIKLELVDIDTGIKKSSALKNLLFSYTPYNAIRFQSVEFENKLISILNEEHFDIVQLEGLYLSFYYEAIRATSNATIVFRAHNIEHEIWYRLAANERNLFKNFYLNVIAKRLQIFETGFLNKYDLLVPITERDADAFEAIGNIKACHVAPVGIEAGNEIVNPLAGKPTKVFYIGALDWFPNQEGLLWFLKHVWPKVTGKYPNVELNVAGRNAPDWLVSKMIGQNVKFWGEVDNARAFMNAGRIMIVPLFSGSGMRVKIVEGMFMGKTIVSTEIGVEGTGATHNENIIICNKPADFAENIIKLIENKDLVDRISLNAREFAMKTYDNLKICESLLEFYSKHLK